MNIIIINYYCILIIVQTQRGVYYSRQRDNQGRTPSLPLPTDGSTQVELSNSGDSIVGTGATRTLVPTCIIHVHVIIIVLIETNGSPSKRDKGYSFYISSL